MRPTRSASLDDVDEDAAVVLDRGGLDDCAEGLGGSPASPDDLSVVIIVDRELQNERTVVLLELLDLHPLGMVDEELREVLEQLAQRER